MSQAYDVFLCFKNLDEQGSPTEDAVLAQQVYDFLVAREVRVFFSNVSLEKLGISAYKRAIDLALDSAQTVVAVGTSAKNLDSAWVRYEWESFYSDVLSGIKPQGRVFTYAKDVARKDLPRTLRQAEVIFEAPGSLERLFRFITNAVGKEPRPSSSGQDEPQNASSQPSAQGAATDQAILSVKDDWDSVKGSRSYDSIEGFWSSRWTRGDEKWREGIAAIEVSGSEVHISYEDRSSRYKIEATWVGRDKLAGRYWNLNVKKDTTEWTGTIVSNSRIDGKWSQGRWDFRR